MPKFVGMDDDGLDEADEFAPAETTRLVKSQGKQRDNARQQYILRFLRESGPAGATAKECVAEGQRVFDKEEYHGPVSGALSTMRKAGLVVMLRKKRSNYYVYVHPDHVGDSPVRELEEPMFGRTKARDASAEEVTRLSAEVERLRAENERLDRLRADALNAKSARDVQVDNLLADVERLTNERNQRAALAEQRESQLADANDKATRDASIKNTQEGIIASLREQVQDLEEELAKPAPTVQVEGPRKVLTQDEQRLLAGVAKALEKHPTDGTPDAPARITVRVSTLRSLGRALQRVTSV
jgi:polyhydroxyalkanoate synthesis regulator phasin